MNYIIQNSKHEPGDPELIFGIHKVVDNKFVLVGVEEVEYIDAVDMEDLCVKLGAYTSRGEARRAGRTGPIPPGYSEKLKLSKHKIIFLWNPQKYTYEYDED